MYIPTHWTLQRKGAMPIIEAQGSSSVVEAEFFMIQSAVELIEKAYKFKGFPFLNDSYQKGNAAFTISFSLMFPSIEELHNFINSLEGI